MIDNLTYPIQLMLEACLAGSRETREQAVRLWEEHVIIDDMDFGASRLVPYFFHLNKQDGIETVHDKRLKVIYKHWWLRSHHITHQLKIVHNALSEEGIRLIIYKGAAIKLHYERDELRPMADFDLLITGVGMTATAYALGKHLSGAYKLVLNLGIAGAFDRAIPLGTVVNVTSDEFTELGAEDGDEFLGIEQLGFGEASFTAANNQLHPSVTKLKQVKGITVNLVHGNENSIKKVLNQANPQTESMEGAAVLYCCHQASLPCLQIRSISNYVVRRNKENWKIGLAVKQLNEWAIEYLTNT